MNNKHNHCTPEQLYLKMLEIGSECISCGIKYHDLKSKLCLKGLLNSNDSDETIKILFENSFTDRNSTCLKPYYEEEKPCDSKYGKENDEHFKYNHLENCVHYLTNEALMNLLHLRESENNRVISANLIKTSKRTLCISGIAILIAVLSALSPIFYDWWYETNELKTLKSINQKISEQIMYKQKKRTNPTATQQSQIHIYNYKSSHYQDSLSSVSFEERNEKAIKPIKNISKTVESLNK